MSLAPGSDFGPYRLEDLVGAGSQAAVYSAYQTALRRHIALKVFGAPEAQDHDLRVDLSRMGAVLARLQHPGIVRMYDVGEIDGVQYLAEELITGGSLSDRLRMSNHLSLDQSLQLLWPLSAALDYAHERDVLHLDLKPENVLLRPDGSPVITDFGLALTLQGMTAMQELPAGTPGYMAPEQLIPGQSISSAADIFAFAALVFHMLAGEPPYSVAPLHEMIKQRIEGPVPSAPDRNPAVSAEVDAILRRGLAQEPTDRWPSAAEMISALARLPREAMSSSTTPLWTIQPSPPQILFHSRGYDANRTGVPTFLPGTLGSASRTRTPMAAPLSSAPTGLGWRVAIGPLVALAALGSAAVTAAQRIVRRRSEPALATPALVIQSLPVSAPPNRTAVRREASGGSAAGERDAVEFTVFSEAAVCASRTFLVQVFAHRPEHADMAAHMASEFDAATSRRGCASLEADIAPGTRLAFGLVLPGLIVDDPVQTLVWQGVPRSIQFGVGVPQHMELGTIVGTVTVWLEDVPVGHVKFKVRVVHSNAAVTQPATREVGDSARAYHQAFVSYASEDRIEVLKRVQMLAKVGIAYFQDVLDLEPGERWERALYRHIDESDLFLLFWSTAATNSEWVLKEVRYAINCKGGDEGAPPEIVPVPIEGPPPVPAPAELAALHFNDRVLYFMH